jgi:hypothetical protein
MAPVVAMGVAAALAAAPAGGVAVSGVSIAYLTGSAESLPSVWSAGAGGGSARRLGPGDAPLLSPSGETVAASDIGSSGSALTLYPANGGAPTGYFNIVHVSATALAWSPDSRYLAVALTGNNAPSLSGYGLAIIDTLTGTEQTIASGAIYGASFAPGSADTLAYARATSLSVTAAANIYTVGADGTATKQITIDGRSADPVWGTRGIAFDHEQFRKGYAPLDQIWLMRANGSGRKQITHTHVSLLASGLAPLAFSADGTRLAAEFEGEDMSIGYSVSVLTGRATELTVGNASVSAWGISRDGRSILVTVGGFEQPPNRGKIEEIPFSGGHPTLLIAHGGFPSWNL